MTAFLRKTCDVRVCRNPMAISIECDANKVPCWKKRSRYVFEYKCITGVHLPDDNDSFM